MKEHDLDNTATRIRDLVAEQASDWLIRLESAPPSAGELAAFTDWLTASPANVAEFLSARATWEALTGRAFEHLADDETLLRQLSISAGPEVTALRTHTLSRSTRRSFALAAGIAGLLSIAGAVLWSMRSSDPNQGVYATAVGEQQTHVLPDGSNIALNTRSRIRMEWSGHYRDLHLDAGEALFQVARDPSRPFRVFTGNSVVQAVGTRFNVYRSAEAITVTVLEGRVDVQQDGVARERGPGIPLTAGKQAQIRPSGAVETRHLSAPDRAIAWWNRRLIFDGEALTQVAEEFNRYHEVPLVIADKELGAKRIHGIFDAADRESLITFLADTDKVRVELKSGLLVVRRE